MRVLLNGWEAAQDCAPSWAEVPMLRALVFPLRCSPLLRLITIRIFPFVFLPLLHFTPSTSGSLAAQQEERLCGVITDAYSGRLLSGVRVTVVQEDRSTVSDREGRFALTDLTLGRNVIRFQRDGYVAEVHAVDLSRASSTPTQFSLTPLAIVIRELRVAVSPEPGRTDVTGSRLRFLEPQLRDEGGSVADFLQGGVTGLAIRRRSTPGGRTGNVLIRGNSSMLSNNPLIIVDGVRLEGMEILDELPLSHVSSIEIVRGPEAMNFGLGAGHGVIVIHTGSRDAAGPGSR